MKRLRYLLNILIIFLICSAILITPALAHPSSQASIIDNCTCGCGMIGTEGMGWKINETEHFGGTKLTYKYHSSVPSGSTYANNFRLATGLWTSATSATFSNNQNATTGVGTIKALSYSSMVSARVVWSSTGHGANWNLEINSNATTPANSVILAHEIGHAFGLAHLFNSTNQNKLMYATNGRTSTGVTTADSYGFAVITGLHTSHTWSVVTSTFKMCTYCGATKTG